MANGNGHSHKRTWTVTSGIIGLVTLLLTLLGVGVKLGMVGEKVNGLEQDSEEFKFEIRDLKATESKRHDDYQREFKAIRSEQKADTERIIDKIDELKGGR